MQLKEGKDFYFDDREIHDESNMQLKEGKDLDFDDRDP